jgi:hypothetical protein
MTGFQRVIVGLAAMTVALRAFLPITTPVVTRSGTSVQVLLAPTLLHIVGILVLAAAVFILFPSPHWRTLLKKGAVALVIVVASAFVVRALVDSLRGPEPAKPLAPSPPPAPITQANPSLTLPRLYPTVSELADDPIVQRASNVLDIWVDNGTAFQQLHASDKDTLCAAGKAIRDAMKEYHNSRADLNHTEQAIFNITAPAGRCH